MWKEHYFNKWGKVKRAKPEDTICLELVNAIRQHILYSNFNGVFLHIENETGGKRSALYNLLKKLTGKIAGAADYIFIKSNYTLFMEIKTPIGKQSKNQKMFESWCIESQVDYIICKSADEALLILREKGFILS